jgi:WXG100 family type VII secretion target
MAQIEGMDVNEISAAISTLNNAVQELQTLIASTNGAYSKIETGWVGQDANQFHGQWPSFTSALNSAHSGLQQLATHLQQNYQAQVSASNSY